MEELEILKTLQSIDATLKRIEKNIASCNPPLDAVSEHLAEAMQEELKNCEL